MEVSVLIPAFNSARTIERTIASVLDQTTPPDEILVTDDGSTDNTADIVRSFGERVQLFQQENRGVAASRNRLFMLARGELLAFLDADDLWHPRYLEFQCRLFSEHPDAVAFFTGHVNFHGYGAYQWDSDPMDVAPAIETISPLSFLKRYNRATGPFASMSYCCVPKAVLSRIGTEPFRISSVDDSHLCTLLPLFGPVVYSAIPLAAYRVTANAQSVNRLKTFGCWVKVFEVLKDPYERQDSYELLAAFRAAFASQRRQYGKLLMSAGQVPEARAEFRDSLLTSITFGSMGKSLGLLMTSYLPSRLQPCWPPIYR